MCFVLVAYRGMEVCYCLYTLLSQNSCFLSQTSQLLRIILSFVQNSPLGHINQRLDVNAVQFLACMMSRFVADTIPSNIKVYIKTMIVNFIRSSKHFKVIQFLGLLRRFRPRFFDASFDRDHTLYQIYICEAMLTVCLRLVEFRPIIRQYSI